MKIILINGNSGSGKDTIAKYINSKVENSYIIPNSYGVKKIAREVFDIEPEEKTDTTRYVCDNITRIGYKIYKYYWENIAFDYINNEIGKLKLQNATLIIPDFRIWNTFDFYNYIADEIITIKLIGTNNRDTAKNEKPTEWDINLKNCKFNYEIETTGHKLEYTQRFIDFILHARGLVINNYKCKYANIVQGNKYLICPYKSNNYKNDSVSIATSKNRCPEDVMLDNMDAPVCCIIHDNPKKGE